MPNMCFTLRLAFVLITLVISHAKLYSQGRHSQIVLAFPEEKITSHRYDPNQRAFILEITGAAPQDLEAVYQYDETLIRRVLLKDLAGQATEVHFILRDDAIRVMLNRFQEPFRLTLDFFDADYKETIDPSTGLPLPPLHNQVAKTPTALPLTAGPNPVPTNPSQLVLANSGPPVAIESGKRRLLQAQPEALKTPQELVLKLQDTTGGLGQNWKNFPPYIYRIQIASFKVGKSYENWMKEQSSKAMSSTESLAQYAGQLFDFGHEQRALVAYQKILHEDPSVFDRHAEHLWKIGEIHLGQGNLTLADGYFESLQEKHPDHPLAAFAALRRLDVRSLRLFEQNKSKDFRDLAQNLDRISHQKSEIIVPLIALRKAYWLAEPEAIAKLSPEFKDLPSINQQTKMQLEESSEAADSPRTRFLIQAILLAHRLQKETWNQETALFASDFFERYKGKATEPYRDLLLKASEASIIQSIAKHMQKSQHAEIIAIMESLPKGLDEVKKSGEISWAAAESYRKAKMPEPSLPYYEQAARLSSKKPDQFRAHFWRLQAALQAQDSASTENAGSDKKQSLQKATQGADRATLESWKSLTPEEKGPIFAEIKAELEANIRHPALIESSPSILLEIWGQKLASDTPTAGSLLASDKDSEIPTAKMIRMIADLGKKFDQLGKQKDKSKTILLLKKINLKGSPLDKESLRIWTDELTLLAEEFRKNNDYLEAGRLFTLTGKDNNQWEGRAEALYKGGLLLYRSGRREEALDAFKQASEDGNNLLYAELAKKRLEQIQK